MPASSKCPPVSVTYVIITARAASPFIMGITVIYIQSEGKFVISGIPEDDDAGTCLGLEGKLGAPTWEVVSLRPDLDCIQRDGEFLYSDPISTDRFDCRYCRDKVCSSSSFVDIVPIPTPEPNGPTDSKVVVIVAVSVSAGIFFLTLAIAMCYFCKCFSCGKVSPRNELRRNGPQPNPSVAVFNPSCDEPPSYVQAAELDVNAGKNDDEPPPAYDDCASSNAALQATDENEEQV
ncbi:uncharacterized protein LOC119735303 [Patiria miniata]|uniref:Uncharacterized protein n=1 Tax=Patiria miniata TaxID=46514 RepID=A0A914ALP2_PATMI|nr:uncharacterized protein LOC119735303 [Patiria miniata]